MPQATNLDEAYNNFTIEPLREEKEFEEFYVPRPSMTSPIDELKDRIEKSKRPEKYLLLGFRGCGKSTELNRLTRMLNQDRFLVVNYSVQEELDINDFDFRDFFASMALKIYDLAEKEVKLKQEIKEDFREFMMEITHTKEEDVTKHTGVGLSFSNLILLKLGREAKSREYIRKELETKISDLIQRLQWLIIEVVDKLRKRIVVIVDDLDKLARYPQAEGFFYQNYSLLLQPNCFIIYTFPIPLAFNPYFENVRHGFDDDLILPQPPVKTKDGERVNQKNFDFYRKIAEKRADLNLIEEQALTEAILSTGKLSEFISIMRDAAIKAHRNKKGKITRDEVGSALEKLRRTYDRTLNDEHITRLLEIHGKKEARDRSIEESISRDLLFSLTAVEYEDEEGRWCDVNPVLLPLVEEWNKKLSTR